MIFNKKGNVRDVALTAVILLGLAIGLISFAYTFSEMSTRMVNTEAINESMHSENIKNVINSGNDTMGRTDVLILFAFIGLVLSLIISAFFIDVHSIYAGIYILGLFIIVGVSIIIQYVYIRFSSLPVFATTVTSFPITEILFNNLGIFMTIAGLLGLIATYAKSKMGIGE